MKQIGSIVILFLLASSICAQNLDDIIQDIYQVMQEQAESTDETVDFSLLQSELQSRAEHPIYLPMAKREDFASLYFLSAQQIDNLLYFLYMHRNTLVTLGQLQLVPGLADYELRDLLPFCTLTPPDSLQQDTRTRSVKQELLAQFRYTNEDSGNYLGDPLTERLRYRLEAGTWSAALKVEKDAFEPYYYPGRTYGADFYGGYVQWAPQGMIRKRSTAVDRVVLGDYLVNYGLGLVVRQTPTFYSSSALDLPADGIKGYNGMDEYRFMRGVGASFRRGDWQWSAFYSAKRVDGLASDGVFQVFSKTGYHRTETELNRKQQTWEQQAGLHADWSHGNWQLGLTVVGDFLRDTLRLRSTYYNANYFSGTSCLVGGLTYRYQANWLTLFGETAVSSQVAVATLDGFHMQLNYHWALESAVRYYSRRFDNPLADCYGTFSHANDERGWQSQVFFSPSRQQEYSLAADFFDYSYPKYGYRQPGWGWRVSLTQSWTIRSDLLFSSLVRWINKDQHLQDGTGLLRTRLRWSTDTWRLYTQLAATLAPNSSSGGSEKLCAGISVAEQARYTFLAVPLYLEAELAYVYAPNYQARMYLYESGGLGFGRSALLYGNGIRSYLDAGYAFNLKSSHRRLGVNGPKLKLFARATYDQCRSNRLTAELHLLASW